MKINTWRNWKDATQALSKLFGYKIPNFGIVVYRNEPDDEFTQFIRRIK